MDDDIDVLIEDLDQALAMAQMVMLKTFGGPAQGTAEKLFVHLTEMKHACTQNDPRDE